MRTKTKKNGFTLVELAIVIAILGILAIVAIPKYQGMVNEARSAAARAQLGTVRSAIAISYAKSKGIFPATLDGTIFADGTMPFVEITTDALGATVVSSNTVVTVSSNTGGWFYTASTGVVRINSTGTDVGGNPPTNLWNTY